MKQFEENQKHDHSFEQYTSVLLKFIHFSWELDLEIILQNWWGIF